MPGVRRVTGPGHGRPRLEASHDSVPAYEALDTLDNSNTPLGDRIGAGVRGPLPIARANDANAGRGAGHARERGAWGGGMRRDRGARCRRVGGELHSGWQRGKRGIRHSIAPGTLARRHAYPEARKRDRGPTEH